jgi:FlaA1/EpsC-like NDP-sugar epimerase
MSGFAGSSRGYRLDKSKAAKNFCKLQESIMSSSLLVRFSQAILRRNAWFAAVFQGSLVFISLVLAWLLSFDFSLPHRHILLTVAPMLVVIRLTVIAGFGLLHGWWRYVSVEDVVEIIKADLLGAAVFFLVIRYVFAVTVFPRSVYVLEALLTGALLIGVRVLSRLLAETFRQDLALAKSARKVVVIGAGQAAEVVLRQLKQAGYQILACVDDDRTKVGLKIHGVPVVGTADQLPRLFGSNEEEYEVIIAVPSATGAQMRRFVEICEKTGRRYRTIPTMRELIAGEVLVKQLREVHLEDLLGREPVRLDIEAVRGKIIGKVVMVTGAAGSIGSEICRQILECAPAKLVCLDQDETGIFDLQRELSQLSEGTPVFSVANVRDGERLRAICCGHRVNVIFHAAAYKHVPVMETNVQEAVTNNVFALLNLLEVAEEAKCTDFVLISTDKAVNPTSIMGVTKRICEIIVASRPPNGLRCVSVRFGNVLGSSGSVVPIFQEQLRQNRPLTVTHAEIQRFFMTSREAVSLVLQAFVIGNHGDVLALDMGVPIKIVDLARSLIYLSGKSERDVPIRFTGLRPGEKMTEDLFCPTEEILPTSCAGIKRTRGRLLSWPELMRQLSELRTSMTVDGADPVIAKIKEIVPEYSVDSRRYQEILGSSSFSPAHPSTQSIPRLNLRDKFVPIELGMRNEDPK